MTTDELIAKLEQATEASVELDGLVAKQFREIPESARFEVTNTWGQEVNQWIGGAYGAYVFYTPEPYSSTIDAGVDLASRELGPGVIWRTGNDATQGSGVLVATEEPKGAWSYKGGWITGTARLAPLGLVIAIIRAHEQLKRDS